MDLKFGPEGALYGLEYGDGLFSENRMRSSPGSAASGAGGQPRRAGVGVGGAHLGPARLTVSLEALLPVWG